ncbi:MULTISPECIES: Rv3235 family protein [Streptomyces]|uniref:Rv3235 family protein n=1 Tax=Streptomyces heilongjiangensis TaxID=945052 RepID=A0ABW1BEX3_9ACTN|nr:MULTISPECIES: Rv3235 family protein [Streptomyces]MDC2951844.1 Rv3235 family protein [Streptomyces heilongjiangensis]
MNKVMTRTQRRPGSRPPVRHDTRRPGRTPARTTPGGGRTPLGTRTTPAARSTAAALLPEVPTPPAAQRPRPTDRFADLLLAVLSGRRPVHSMLRHTAGRAYDELAWLAERGPLRAVHGTDPVVRDIGYYVAAPGALEVFARIGAGDRLSAMAFRLEHGPDHRWRCTAVELGGPRRPHTTDD